jgi:hypothetical protein
MPVRVNAPSSTNAKPGKPVVTTIKTFSNGSTHISTKSTGSKK